MLSLLDDVNKFVEGEKVKNILEFCQALDRLK